MFSSSMQRNEAAKKAVMMAYTLEITALVGRAFTQEKADIRIRLAGHLYRGRTAKTNMKKRPVVSDPAFFFWMHETCDDGDQEFNAISLRRSDES
jgi:hypothetical protein